MDVHATELLEEEADKTGSESAEVTAFGEQLSETDP
jgi:hypothetical protein